METITKNELHKFLVSHAPMKFSIGEDDNTKVWPVKIFKYPVVVWLQFDTETNKFTPTRNIQLAENMCVILNEEFTKMFSK